MRFCFTGKAKNVFGRLKDMEDTIVRGDDTYYMGARSGPGAGSIKIMCMELGQKESDGMQMTHVNIKPLGAGPSQALLNHSPDGFEWGYSGSGPAQLALALLLDATGDSLIALKYHQDFKERFVADWGNSWHISGEQIKRWIKLRQFHEHLEEAERGG
jgi:hypothetical protein